MLIQTVDAKLHSVHVHRTHSSGILAYLYVLRQFILRRYYDIRYLKLTSHGKAPKLKLLTFLCQFDEFDKDINC